MATTQLKDKDGSNVYPAIEGGSEGNGNGLNSNFSVSSEYWYSYNLLTEQGYITSSGGVDGDEESDSSYKKKWLHTDFLPIVCDSMTVEYSKPDWGSYNYAYYAFYDENKTFITGKAFLCKDAKNKVTHDFSEWSTKPAYVRFSGVPCYVNGDQATYGYRLRFWFRAVQVLNGGDAVVNEVKKHQEGTDKMHKILLFGNSFTLNTMNPMEELCMRLGVTNFYIQVVALAGQPIGTYVTKLNNRTTPFESGDYLPAVNMFETYPNGIMVDILSHDWDIVFFQNSSTASENYTDNDDTNLTTLIKAVKTYCTNPHVKIGWLFTWETWQGSAGATRCYPYSSISAAVQRMKGLHPDVIVVPAGTAIQNARGTTLNMDGDTIIGEMLSYDFQEKEDHSINWYQHLATGAGQYIACYTFYEKILAPITGKSFLLDDIVTSGSGTGVVNITDNNRTVVQNCVLAALRNPWEVTDPSELDPDYVAPESEPER